jgi:hypothetical protein
LLVIASVHIADVGVGTSLKVLRKAPSPASVSGLRWANVALAAALDKSVLPKPMLGRVALVAFWDGDDALDRFLVDDPGAKPFAGGWRLRLDPLRAWGSWPGVPADLSRSRTVDHEGLAAVLTLGRLRWPQGFRFLRTSAKAEAAVVDAPGLTWATGMARPPFFCTCSLWQSSDALSAYAFTQGGAHHGAIAADRGKPFHHQSAFIRFRPYGSVGSLEGKNPLREHWLSPA